MGLHLLCKFGGVYSGPGPNKKNEELPRHPHLKHPTSGEVSSTQHSPMMNLPSNLLYANNVKKFSSISTVVN
jgi:hypothetical protein